MVPINYVNWPIWPNCESPLSLGLYLFSICPLTSRHPSFISLRLALFSLADSPGPCTAALTSAKLCFSPLLFRARKPVGRTISRLATLCYPNLLT